MNGDGEERTCLQCHQVFAWRREDAERLAAFLERKGAAYQPPNRCPACRARAKAAERPGWRVTACSCCGLPTAVPPEVPAGVELCPACYEEWRVRASAHTRNRVK